MSSSAPNEHQTDDKVSSPSHGSSTESTVDVEAIDSRRDGPSFASPTHAGDIGRLGKYRIQKELGRGGMGAVYLAFDERLERPVALKVMLPKAAATPTAKERFLREARAAASISSDHVVAIHEADEIDGVPFIAQQFLQGYPLDSYLQKKGLPTIDQAVRIARETALGLDSAHQLGLIHRDIKPANVWLEAPGGRVKILDFGLAKPVEERGKLELTASGAVVGTPCYMSPEQGKAQPLDGRSDLFSLGVMLYRLVCGELPFDGPTLMAVLTAIATEEPKPVTERNPLVPPDLAHLIHRLLAKKPEHRPASAKHVADELEQIGHRSMRPAPDAHTATPQVVYVPIPVSVEQPNPFANLTEQDSPSELDPSGPADVLPGVEANQRKLRVKAAVAAVGGLLAVLLMAAAGVIIIKITNKDGTVTKIEIPDDAKVEVNGKAVTPEPKKPPVKLEPKAKLTGNPDREAAQQLLAFKNVQLVLRADDGQDIYVPSGKPLPEGPFVVRAVQTVPEVTPVETIDTPKFLKAMARLEHVVSIYDTSLSILRLSQAELETLSKFPCRQTLTHMECGFDLTPEAAALIASFPNLQKLGCSGERADATAFKSLAKLRHLDQLALLSFAAFRTPTDADWKALAQLPLTALSLKDPRVLDPKGMQMIAAMPSLRYLGILATHKHLDEAAATALGQSQSIRWLHYFSYTPDRTYVPADVLAPLVKMPQLRMLAFGGNCELPDATLATLHAGKQLIQIEFNDAKLTQAGWNKLTAALPKCQLVSTHGTVGPDLIQAVQREAAAWVLSVGGTVKVNGEEKVRTAGELPTEGFRVTEVSVPNDPRVKSTGLALLANLPYLTTVSVESPQFTDANLRLLRNWPTLYNLFLIDCNVTDDGLASLPELKSLANLSLYRCDIGDAGMLHLKACRNLKALALPATKVGDAGLIELGRCGTLEYLNLNQSLVTDTGLLEVTKLPKLAGLALKDTAVGDAGVHHLKACKALTRLDIRNTKVTKAKFEELKQQLPNCKVESDHGTHDPKK